MMRTIYGLGICFVILFIATFSGYVHGYESGREEGRILQMQEDYLSDTLSMRMELDSQLQEAIKDIPR